jgi:hypothetical protein
MTLKSSEQKVLDILQKEKVNYQGIFEIILIDKIQLSDEFISEMHDLLIENFLNQTKKLNENARIDHLKEIKKRFQNVFETLTDEYSPEFDSSKLNRLKKNIIGSLKEIIKASKGELTKKLPKPIKINCDNVVLLALFQELSQEIFIGNKFDYRISQLVSDNFINKNGKPISSSICYKELNEGAGITETARKKLRELLVRITDKLD